MNISNTTRPTIYAQADQLKAQKPAQPTPEAKLQTKEPTPPPPQGQEPTTRNTMVGVNLDQQA